LLCYVTIDSDRESTAYESLDLELLINEVWKSQSGTDALELTLELQHPPLNAPRKHIVLILKHLIANAVVHHDKKAGCVRVTLSHTKRTSSVCIQDDGPGIDPQYRQEALRLFSTLKKRDEKEGSGMGLPIVNKIVSSLGGKLNFGLGLHGRGSSISISIPRCSTH
ncbi:MAG: sensor histidine kinase, partial [Granulosicoccaceae bacterium]